MGGGGLCADSLLNRGAFLNMSGTTKNLTCEPRTNTWSICVTWPFRAVAVTSLSWQFMLSSLPTNLPRYVSPVVSSSDTVWPWASFSSLTGIPEVLMMLYVWFGPVVACWSDDCGLIMYAGDGF